MTEFIEHIAFVCLTGAGIGFLFIIAAFLIGCINAIVKYFTGETLINKVVRFLGDDEFADEVEDDFID